MAENSSITTTIIISTAVTMAEAMATMAGTAASTADTAAGSTAAGITDVSGAPLTAVNSQMFRRDFDLRALYEALDARRRERALSWTAVAAEVNRFRTTR